LDGQQALLKHLETHPDLHMNEMQSFLMEKCRISASHSTIRRKLKEAGWWTSNKPPRRRGGSGSGTRRRAGAGSAGHHRVRDSDSPASPSSYFRRLARHLLTSHHPNTAIAMAERKANAEALVPSFKFERLLNQGKLNNKTNTWKRT
jgi:hypothetical protein